jgi:fibro-slime domain-containing protein
MTMQKVSFLCLLYAAACSSPTNESRFGAPSTSTTTASGQGGSIVVGTGGSSTGAGGSIVVNPPDMDGGKEAAFFPTLPPDFTPAGNTPQKMGVGGYKLGGALDGGVPAGPVNGSDNCGNILLAVVRDFKGREQGGHPDFQGPLYGNNITPDLVAKAIGADQKPVYTSQCEEGHPMPAPICPFQAETTTQANFDQWYRHTPGVNQPFVVYIYFAPQGNGRFLFDSPLFFPIDNVGFGNSGNADDGKSHNFSFTTEMHTRFAYSGGEVFTFIGDDDVWVFINNVLAVDVGGLHPPETQTVDLDASAQQLGILKGTNYNLDLFHAERHTPQSTFRIETNLAFVNCGTIPPDIPR